MKTCTSLKGTRHYTRTLTENMPTTLPKSEKPWLPVQVLFTKEVLSWRTALLKPILSYTHCWIRTLDYTVELTFSGIYITEGDRYTAHSGFYVSASPEAALMYASLLKEMGIGWQYNYTCADFVAQLLGIDCKFSTPDRLYNYLTKLSSCGIIW